MPTILDAFEFAQKKELLKILNGFGWHGDRNKHYAIMEQFTQILDEICHSEELGKIDSILIAIYAEHEFAAKMLRTAMRMVKNDGSNSDSDIGNLMAPVQASGLFSQPVKEKYLQAFDAKNFEKHPFSYITMASVSKDLKAALGLGFYQTEKAVWLFNHYPGAFRACTDVIRNSIAIHFFSKGNSHKKIQNNPAAYHAHIIKMQEDYSWARIPNADLIHSLRAGRWNSDGLREFSFDAGKILEGIHSWMMHRKTSFKNANLYCNLLEDLGIALEPETRSRVSIESLWLLGQSLGRPCGLDQDVLRAAMRVYNSSDIAASDKVPAFIRAHQLGQNLPPLVLNKSGQKKVISMLTKISSTQGALAMEILHRLGMHETNSKPISKLKRQSLAFDLDL